MRLTQGNQLLIMTSFRGMTPEEMSLWSNQAQPIFLFFRVWGNQPDSGAATAKVLKEEKAEGKVTPRKCSRTAWLFMYPSSPLSPLPLFYSRDSATLGELLKFASEVEV